MQHQTHQEGMDKNVAFTMYSTFYQLKIDSYTYRLLYMSSMVTINKKKNGRCTKDNEKNSKHSTTESHQTTREETKRRKEKRGNTKQIKKKFTKW